MGGMWLFWGLLVLALIVGIRWAIGASARGGPPSTERSAGASAEEILEQRYARGEISMQELEEMRAHLRR